MRKHTILISERMVVFCIAGQLFSQAPNRKPRKAEIIMDKVLQRIRKDFYNDNEYYTLRIEKEKVYDYIENLLTEIDEFRELNLSHIEYSQNIAVDDPNRGKYNFTSRYDKYDSESWKTDFIDLDAFIGNVHNRLIHLQETDNDCFCCIHDETTDDKCSTCIINPEFKLNYDPRREPHGKYTFACKYDCFKSHYICCEECDIHTHCEFRCKGKSTTCGNKIIKDV